MLIKDLKELIEDLPDNSPVVFTDAWDANVYIATIKLNGNEVEIRLDYV